MIKERLNLILKELKLSGRAFEKECGLTNGSYSSIGDGVGADKLHKMLVRFPQISGDWLLTGKGEMMTCSDSCEFGSDFGRNRGVNTSNDRENINTIMSRMAGIIADQQQDISRLITELEKNGRRSDRMLRIIEFENGIGFKNDLLVNNRQA